MRARTGVASKPHWRHVRPSLLAAMALLSCLGSMRSAEAQSVEDFYKGRQLKFIVGSAGGGGYDFYSRLIAHHMTRFLPGKPTFVVQAMPGAGGTVAANYLYNVAAQDGSEIGMIGRAAVTQTLLEPTNATIKFDPLKFRWIGSPQQEVGLVLARQPSPVSRFEDLLTKELIVSGTTRMGPPSFYPRVLNALLGTHFNVVEGYKSSQDALLALERGEVSGHASGSSAGPFRQRIEPWLKEGKVKVVAQIGVQRDTAYPDTPAVYEYARTDEQRQIMDLLFAQQTVAWPIVAPPGAPPERVAALREAFDKVMGDKDFLEEAHKLHLIIKPIGGQQIDDLLAKVFRTPKQILDKTHALMK